MLAFVTAVAALALAGPAAALQNLTHLDAYTNFAPAFLSAACARPVHGAWSRCVAGGAAASGGTPQHRLGRALVVPPFPRFAILNPMHALVDHVWAFATAFSACVGDGTIVLMGVRREQIRKYDVAKNLTTWLELDLGHLIPEKKPEDMPDSMAQAPTWGQWFVWHWAKGVVGADRVVFEDDVRKMAREGICFNDGVLSLDADFYGTANRAMRMEFWPPQKNSEETAQAFPWADFPERWKIRGVQDLRMAISKSLGIEMTPRKRAANGELRVLVTTRKGDSRRTWYNSEAGVAELKKEFGDKLDVKVIDKTKGLSFREQVDVYNWADVLVGIHGASQANAIFMRDGSAGVEVWQCCYEDINGRDDLVKAWTGWLFLRMHMSLSYVGGCVEVNEKGVPLTLSAEEKQMEIEDLCGLNQHLNPMYVNVPVSKLPDAIRVANADAMKSIGQDPVPRIPFVPKKLSQTQFQTRPKVIERQYAPVGPGWTQTAIADERNILMRVQHILYDLKLGEKAGTFWEKAKNRTARGLAPVKTYDSITRWFRNTQWDIAWHVGLIPEDIFNTTVSASVQTPPILTSKKKPQVGATVEKPEVANEMSILTNVTKERKSVEKTANAADAETLSAKSALQRQLQEAVREPVLFFFFSGAATAATLIGICHLACRVSSSRKMFSFLGSKKELRNRAVLGDSELI